MNKLILLIGFLFLIGLHVDKTQSQQLTKDDYIGTWIVEGSQGVQLTINESSGQHTFLQGIAFATTEAGIWTLDDDGRIIFYRSADDVSKKAVYTLQDGKYLVVDTSENNNLLMYTKYTAKWRPAKDKNTDTNKDTQKKDNKKETKKNPLDGLFDIFKKK